VRNMMGLVLAASYFCCGVFGVRAKMEILVTHVLKASKRIFGIPDFRYYAIADGIRELLPRYNRRMVKPIKTFDQWKSTAPSLILNFFGKVLIKSSWHYEIFEGKLNKTLHIKYYAEKPDKKKMQTGNGRYMLMSAHFEYYWYVIKSRGQHGQ